MSPLRMNVLGPLRVWRNGVELDTGAPQQSMVLAAMLALANEPVSTSGLIDLVWDDDGPTTATNILHKYVGSLRRLFEPDVPVRASGSFLLRRGSGYALVVDRDVADVVEFREHIAGARSHVAHGDDPAGLAQYLQALALWQGPAADGLGFGPAGAAVFTGLNEEFFDGCIAAARLVSSKDRAEALIRPLRLAAAMAPLNEAVHASLMAVLGVVGRQAEALSLFRTMRDRLVAELGVEPGRTLREVHERVLTPAAADRDETVNPTDPGVTRSVGLEGREGEMAVLRHAIEPAYRGRTAFIVVEGGPGVGKTRLLEEIAAEASSRPTLISWCRPPGREVAPSMWPWQELIHGLADALTRHDDGVQLALQLKAELDGIGLLATTTERVRFQHFERIMCLVGKVAFTHPVLLLFDDLAALDSASIDLLRHLAARQPPGLAVVCALRTHAPVPRPELIRLLASASRVTTHRRMTLTPLHAHAVERIVARQIGVEGSLRVARHIHARTGGNPFLVRELTHMLGKGRSVDRATVPPAVLDVVRARTDVLDDDAIDLLRLAALVGIDADLSVLTRAAGIDAETCLERLQGPEELGLIGPGDPMSLRFPNEVIRAAVVASIPRPLLARLRARVEAALGRTGSRDAGATVSPQ